MIARTVSDSWQSWQRFWFESCEPARMRVFRTVLSAVYFFFFLVRTPDLNFFFSDQGIVELAHLSDAFPLEGRYSLFHVWTSETALVVGHWVFLGCLLLMILGWIPRLAALVAFALHVSFMHRNMAVSFGVDLIATFYFFYFIWIDDKADRREGWRKDLGSVAYRLCQIQLCVIYAYSGIEKLKGVSWWGGSALWDVLANPMLVYWDFSWLIYFLPLLALMAYLTLLWEVYFAILVWIKVWRPWMLVFGVLFHVGIAVTVNIPFFSLMMISFYILFVDRNFWNRFVGAKVPQLRI